jgi:hypothetical protein
VIDFIGGFTDQGCEVVWTSNRDKSEKSRQLHTPLNRKNCLRKPLISGLFRLIPAISALLKVWDNLSDNLQKILQRVLVAGVEPAAPRQRMEASVFITCYGW